jgi:hypothetical protein
MRAFRAGDAQDRPFVGSDGATGFVDTTESRNLHLKMLLLANTEINMRGTAIFLSAALALGLGTAAPAASLNGTVNSGIGAKGAHAGVNGSLHSSANARVNAKNRSSNGIYNSTVGSKGAHTGTNGRLHSNGNRAINSL